jgi:endonuclease/exonuclease/phosphatase family metal-dependent hydrolase
VRLLQLNIEGYKHYSRWRPLIDMLEPDVICLQEIYGPTVARLESELAGRGYSSHFSASSFLKDSRQLEWGTPGLWGHSIFTTGKILSTEEFVYTGIENIPYIDWDDPKVGNSPAVLMRMPLLVAKIEFGGERFTLASTHFTWSANGENSVEQEHHMSLMLPHLEKQSDLIFCGDLNIPRGTPLYDRLALRFSSWLPKDVRSTLDPALHRAGYLDRAVDHLFTSRNIVCDGVKVIEGMSDHKAIFAEKIHKFLQVDKSAGANLGLDRSIQKESDTSVMN